MRVGLVDFGITYRPSCRPQRSITCAVLLPDVSSDKPPRVPPKYHQTRDHYSALTDTYRHEFPDVEYEMAPIYTERHPANAVNPDL
jgi:hypothetical protein